MSDSTRAKPSWNLTCEHVMFPNEGMMHTKHTQRSMAVWLHVIVMHTKQTQRSVAVWLHMILSSAIIHYVDRHRYLTLSYCRSQQCTLRVAKTSCNNDMIKRSITIPDLPCSRTWTRNRICSLRILLYLNFHVHLVTFLHCIIRNSFS